VVDYERALAIDRRMWEAWANRGVVLAALDQEAAAASSFERALEEAPASMRAQIEAARRESLGR
jgi:Tfp pilus assembly protein PilF